MSLPPSDHPFGVHHLPYGAVLDTTGRRFAAVRLGDDVVDLTTLTAGGPFGPLFASGNLDALLAAGARAWADVRAMLTERLTADTQVPRHSLGDVVPVLAFTVADYVDFYASEQHATNVGRIFRPNGAPLTRNWKHLPIGYHGRAGTVVVSGTEIRRPSGQFRDADVITFGPSRRLDIEAEVGFVVGGATRPGEPVPIDRARDHLFGVCLLNDWSARDIQAFETVPLGPFLGKSFATSVAAWITPLEALAHAWTTRPAQDPAPLRYLAESRSLAGLDLLIEVSVNGTVISRPPFASMYWTPAQMLAHLTVNGATLRPGDLFASGTVSGPQPDQFGSLLELTVDATAPLSLPDGRALGFLEDGDEVVITASAPSGHGRITLGECRGRVLPARD